MKHCLLALAVAFSVFSASCGSGRGDPTTTPGGTGDLGGSLASGKNGANLAVTDPNSLAFSLELFKDLYPSFLKAMSGTSIVPEAGGQVRILGGFTGYGIASLPPDTLGTSATINGLEITYYDYSEAGRIFMGGKVTFSGTFSKVGTRWVPTRVILNSGGLAFAGSYSGTVTFDSLRVFFDSQGALIDFIQEPDSVICPLPIQGNMFVNSGGGTLRFNPYYRPCLPF